MTSWRSFLIVQAHPLHVFQAAMLDSVPAKQLFPTLSSASSSSSLDKKLADKSSCPGTFFHLFDWNCHLHKGRLFGHKSLPSGRGRSVLKGETDIEAVLPTLISADENSGGFPPALETGIEDALRMVQTPEKRKKKMPNVVAKLMGLETMPSPEPCRRQRRPLDVQNPNLLCTPEENTYISNSRNLLVRPRSHELDRNIRGCSSGVKSSKKDLLHDLSLRQVNENETKGSKHKEAQLQPLTIKPGIHSHERTHVKSGPAAGNNENIQENKDHKKFTERKLPAARSVKLQSPLPHLHTADRTTQSGMKKDKESINVQGLQHASRPQRENKMLAVKTSTSIATSREEMISQSIMLGENVKQDKGHGKCHLSQQDPSLKNLDKVKSDLKRQEQTCRRLSQTDGEKNQISRSVKAKTNMDACPLNADLKSRDNQRELSTNSTISTVHHDSGGCSTSSILKHKSLSGSARDARNKEGNKIKVQKTGIRGNLSPYVKSSVMRRGNAQASRGYVPTFEKTLSLKKGAKGASQSSFMAHNEGVFDASSIAEECITECSSATHQYSSPSVVCDHEVPLKTDITYMPMLQDNSDVVESAITCESSITCDRVYYEETQGTISSKHCTFRDSAFTEVAAGSSSNVLGITESTCQSSCIEDVGDTASSFETRNEKQSVSYSGKSTATILKELLMALNPSTKQFIVEDTPEEDHATSRLDDFRIAETTGSNNINYIRGQGLNYYADSPSNDNICHDTIKVSNDGRHSLKECNDNCWQPSSNLAWVLPSAYGFSMNFESFSSVQEREGCGQESCRQVVGSKQFAREKNISLSPQKHAGAVTRVLQSEEDYLKHVLSSANLSLSKIYSARLLLSGPLIESALFDEVEENFQHQWKWGIQHEHKDEDVGSPYDHAARINRKLLFDCIGEALKLDIGVNEQESLQNNMLFLHPSSPDSCSRRIQRHINDWKAMSCGINVDDMVEKEMNSGIGKWVEFPSEVYQIAVDVETSILKDFIAELVLDLSTVFQKVPIEMRCKNKGLAKAQKEKHFWVGL